MAWRQLFAFEPSGLIGIVITATISYSAVMLMLRIAAKRTLSSMTAFDLIIPLTLGPILASTILSGGASLAEGLLAFGFLVALHSLVARLTFHVPAMVGLLEHQPVLLFYEGEFIDENLVAEKVTQREVRQAVRSQGLADRASVFAVILEADGSLNVVEAPEQGGAEFSFNSME